MAVDFRHPDYVEREAEWRLMRDASRGEEIVKAAGERYLLMPNGYRGQPDGGYAFYKNYLMRANFPDILEPTVIGMVGLVHHREPLIEFPPAMEYLFERATVDGMPLDVFHRKMTREIFTCARYGIIVDAPQEGTREPYLAGYAAETIINWRQDRSLIVLDETHLEDNPRDEFELVEKIQYRVLRYVDGVYSQQIYDKDKQGGEVIDPTPVKGAFEEMPFVIVGPRDLDVSPDNLPLVGIARAAFSIYRFVADYRHQLYWSGQETLVGIGVREDEIPSNVGAGAFIRIQEGGDVKYVGPSGKGIEAHRLAIQDERDVAVSLGATLLESSKREAESGEALSIRMASKNASLKTIAMSSAAALERALRNVAIFLGLDPEQVVVKPDLKFVDVEMSTKSATELMQLWIGEAISYQTLYENLQRGGIASEERDFEEEKVLIEEEIALEEPDPLDPNADPNAVLPDDQEEKDKPKGNDKPKSVTLNIKHTT